MSRAELLSTSASVEKAASLLALLVLGGLYAWSCRRDAPSTDRVEELNLSRVGEGLALLCILLLAVVLRVVKWDEGIPGTIYAGEVITARADLLMRRGGLMSHWWSLLRQPNLGGTLYDSPVIQPFVVGFQWLFGGRIHSIALAGAVFGVTSVALAWCLGRLLRGSHFALLFAAFVAVAPLQIVWSRLGYRAVAAIPHVLAVLVLTVMSCRTRSRILALLAGALGYLTVYNYEVSRVVFALSPLAAWTVLRDRPRFWSTFTSFTCIFVATVLLLASTLSRGSLRQTLWPNYGSAAGNMGEKDVVEFVQRNYQRYADQGLKSLRDYFVLNRNSPPEPSQVGWGAQYGGLLFFPVTLLGLVGALGILIRRRALDLWHWVLFLGISMPALGCASARRLIVFDLGWCALAGEGALLLRESRVFRQIRPTVAAGAVAAFILCMGTWSFAVMYILRGTAETSAIYPVPFATGCVGDITTCPRCVAVGKQWENDIRKGALVVLVDSDLDRENATRPAGLPLYGQLAAIAAGKPEAFQELYPILWDFNTSPDFRTYYATRGDFVPFLSRMMSEGRPTRVVWHAERPTAWDLEFATNLSAIGGRLESFKTPLSSGGGFRVETDRAHEARVLDIAQRWATGRAESPRSSCISHELVETKKLSLPPHLVAPALPSWISTNWASLEADGQTWRVPNVVGFALETDASGERIAHVLTWEGDDHAHGWPAGERMSSRYHAGLWPIGLHCAAFRGNGEWWVVKPEFGKLLRSVPGESPFEVRWAPEISWMGVTAAGGEVVLAAAAQEVVVLDVEHERIRERFPARVLPNRLRDFGECTQVLRGRNWIGVFDHPANSLDFYSDEGKALGTWDLTAMGFPWVQALAAHDDLLALGQASSTLIVLKVDTSRCPQEGREALLPLAVP